MSDGEQSFSKRAAEHPLTKWGSHVVLTLVLLLMVYAADTVRNLEKAEAEGMAKVTGQIAGLRDQIAQAVIPRIEGNSQDIKELERGVLERTKDRFTATDGAAMEFRLMREIGEIKQELRTRASKRAEAR